MATDLGLRELKKQQARQLIFETASRLFAERGFDTVTVAEIARAAYVSEPTVFKYFPTKEDLFFGGMAFFEERLLQTVRERAVGESAFTAFRRQVVDGCRRLSADGNADVIAKGASLINASLALQTREREIVARYTQKLAEVLAHETGVTPTDVEPWSVAGALMSTHRALVLFVRTKVLAGQRGTNLASAARSQTTRAFARLEASLGDYAVRRP